MTIYTVCVVFLDTLRAPYVFAGDKSEAATVAADWRETPSVSHVTVQQHQIDTP